MATNPAFAALDRYNRYWRELLKFNDRDDRDFPYKLIFGSLIASLAAALYFAAQPYLAAAAAIGVFAGIHLVFYVQLVLGASSRASKIEEVLPDFLSMVASNIRSGLTPDKALIVSARDEFGPLTEAINKAGKRSITGMPLDQVMLGMSENIQSNILEKTITQIVEGMHSGGDMSELLEKTALDIRKFRSVKKEVNSVILNYELFIIAAITFGAPLLYGVSTFLVDIMIRIRSKISLGDGAQGLSGGVSIFKGKLLLTSDGVTMFAAAAIIITVLFGCMAVGIMGSGRRVDGLKYFPILALIGLALLFGIRYGLGIVLNGIAGV
ncbi:MAG TPA: type II secretion system F family protein [Candidatus Micrarchaeota archaeon]|nr:type II secretion system F family protein [Candidatus Micrarchaeota archaeon]